ncbi:ATP-grasp domain-containing protein [Acetobacter okinawensis]|uniref:ATP-grasp domain-containing protein n=1 Tax=Acetobacter okinawensis TaxID=1076594 RepID=UPI0039E9ABA2
MNSFGLSPLLRQALQGQDITHYRAELLNKAAQKPDAQILLDLALIMQLTFENEQAEAFLTAALKLQQTFNLARADKDALRLLVVKTPGDLTANTPIECILENAPVHMDVVYVGASLAWPQELPPYDLIFVAVGEADTHNAVLADLAKALAHSPVPVLNRPQYIPQLSRSEAYDLLHTVPGLHMAQTYRLERNTLQQIGAGQVALEALGLNLAYPFIVRPLGLHGGIGLSKIDRPADLNAYLADVGAELFFVANFINYASDDQLYRKYRVVLVEGRPYLAHMGISAHWMVHYPYKEMKEFASRREEEAHAMLHFDQEFGQRHAAALSGIYDAVKLDYFGFDCAETTDGRLLVFELSNALIIHACDDAVVFPYKLPQMHKIFAAFYTMLKNRVRVLAAP